MLADKGKVPGGLISTEQLRRLVAEGEVETVTLALPDMYGRLVGKRHQAAHFLDRLVQDGAEACAYLLATDVQMRPLPGYEIASWDTGYGDVRLIPDLRTLRRLPWHRGGALVLANVQHPDGRPLAVAPRQVLHEQIDRLTDLGLTAKTGLETEFTVYRGNGNQVLGDLEPLWRRNLDYALTPPIWVGEYVREVEDSLSEAGLPLEAVKTEAAPGQLEVTFRYGQALTAADNHVAFKHVIKAITPWAEATATFMAAPVTGTGNGLHVHLSLWEGNEPAFPAQGAGQSGLSQTGAHAVAGLVEILPQMMPLLLPTTNSYKRLRPESFAPTRMAWGWDNRTCAVRVTGHGPGLHLEIRIPGADANPYLVLAAVLAACRYGIQHELLPPLATTGSAYDAADAPVLPATLDAALHAFQTSTAALDLLGKEVVAHYATAAQIECDVAATRVTDIERDRAFFDS
jgi:glutamine synthetase